MYPMLRIGAASPPPEPATHEAVFAVVVETRLVSVEGGMFHPTSEARTIPVVASIATGTQSFGNRTSSASVAILIPKCMCSWATFPATVRGTPKKSGERFQRSPGASWHDFDATFKSVRPPRSPSMPSSSEVPLIEPTR
jgi:hypothetical protein